MDFDLLMTVLINGTILAAVVWALVRWRRARRRFTREASARDALAHWRYPQYEWQQFCEAEAARIVRRDLPKVMKKFAGPAIFMLALMWYLYDPAVHVMFDLRIAALIALAGIAAILAAIVLARAGWYLGLRRYEYEVTISADGVYELFKTHGEVRKEKKTLFGAEYDLAAKQIRKEETYSYLALTLRGHKGGEIEKRIPIPRGREAEAGELAARL